MADHRTSRRSSRSPGKIRIWLTCLRRRSQKSRRMSWQTYGALLTRSLYRHPISLIPERSCSMTQVILGKSRVREICMPGFVRAKAEWLSYSTNSCLPDELI